MLDPRIMVMMRRQKERKGKRKKRKYITQKMTPKRRNQSQGNDDLACFSAALAQTFASDSSILFSALILNGSPYL